MIMAWHRSNQTSKRLNCIPLVGPLLARRPTKLAAIALANKLARMAWAMMATGARYNYPASLRV